MLKTLSSLKKQQKKIIVYLNDLIFLFLSFYFFCFGIFTNFAYFLSIFILIVVLYSVFMEFFGGFAEVLKNYTAERLLIHSIPIALSALIILLAYFYESQNQYLFFVDWLGLRNLVFNLLSFMAASFTFLTLTRIVAKVLIYGVQAKDGASNVYIFGINDSSIDLYSIYSTNEEYNIKGFITLDKDNQNRTLLGKKIISYKKALSKFKRNNNFTVFLALDVDENKHRSKIINDLSDLAITVKSIPSYSEYLEKDHLVLGELSVSDILGREERSHDKTLVSKNLSNKKILVTGAGGSIGSEISKLIAREEAEILFLDASEFNLYRLKEHFSKYKESSKNMFKLGDIRDLERMENIFRTFKPDIIFHAAAYKHVPIIEDFSNFSEAIKTNVIGTLQLARLANKYGCERLTFISTDKAVRPTNLMGATKRLAERLLATFSKGSETIISTVRFGNVLQSSGSVIPKFKDQIESGGPVTVTDMNMTRYFMTITEASELVLNATFLLNEYSTYLLKMGEPVKIYDLAKKMINLYGFDVKSDKSGSGIEIIFTGTRPGEKIYEELLVSGNEIETSNNLIFRDETSSTLTEDEQKELLDTLNKVSISENIDEFKELCKNFADYSEPL